jgi:hypothetical protein
MEQEVEELRRQVDDGVVPDDAITSAIDKEGAELVAGGCHVFRDCTLVPLDELSWHSGV